jgi:hypothetical protein
VKSAALSLILALGLAAQPPVKVAYDCSPEDAEQFGMTCSEDQPCAVYLELASAEANANTVFVTGNLHTREVTLFSVLLSSEDGGATWGEAHERIRSAALEQIDFVDLQTGWVSGESIDPLARDPFLLLTTDGGKTWRRKLVFEDTKFGTISQFHFDSRTNGEMVIDASQGKTVRQELYGTMTGGESWEIKQVSNTPLRLPHHAGSWRVRADAASDTYRLERGEGQNWETMASFLIHVADCH